MKSRGTFNRVPCDLASSSHAKDALENDRLRHPSIASVSYGHQLGRATFLESDLATGVLEVLERDSCDCDQGSGAGSLLLVPVYGMTQDHVLLPSCSANPPLLSFQPI